MLLSSSSSRGALRHTRAIRIDAHARGCGLRDSDAHISDTKARDVNCASGVRLAGIQGCTHLTEFAQMLPIAAIQALAGEVIDTRQRQRRTEPQAVQLAAVPRYAPMAKQSPSTTPGGRSSKLSRSPSPNPPRFIQFVFIQ